MRAGAAWWPEPACAEARVWPSSSSSRDCLLEGMGVREGAGRWGHYLPVAWFQGQLEGHLGPPDFDSWYQLRFGKLLAVDSLPLNSQVRTGAWACRALCPGLTLG